ncbi:MAG: hydrogenase expression/formation protein HypE [Candidatus Bathyarchaeia archaeon]
MDKSDRIVMAHGAGGYLMHRLIKEHILSILPRDNFEVGLHALDDSAVVNDVVFKSDSYTVKPLFFPGGDIGRLAVSGTVNDISVMGGKPIALSLALVLEEGFPIYDLDRIMHSIASTCREAEVYVVTGDTKVVEKGSLDGCIINCSGIGVRSQYLDYNIDVVRRFRGEIEARWLLDSNIRPGDKIIVSGTIGDHGVAILSCREGYGFESSIKSDVRPLNKMIEKVLSVGGVVSMKDPTRGGLANLLNEWSEKSHVGILIREEDIPIREGVRAACEMLGIDPLEIGNEGKIVLAVVAEMAEEILEVLRETDEGRDAAIIGEATDEFEGVAMETLIGGKRIIPPPLGDPVPRIC